MASLQRQVRLRLVAVAFVTATVMAPSSRLAAGQDPHPDEGLSSVGDAAHRDVITGYGIGAGIVSGIFVIELLRRPREGESGPFETFSPTDTLWARVSLGNAPRDVRVRGTWLYVEGGRVIRITGGEYRTRGQIDERALFVAAKPTPWPAGAYAFQVVVEDAPTELVRFRVAAPSAAALAPVPAPEPTPEQHPADSLEPPLRLDVPWPDPRIVAPRMTLVKKPLYPEHLEEQKIVGTLLLEVTIEKDGSVDTRSIRVVRGLQPDLDRATVAALATSRFTPATREGVPVRVTMKIPYTFRFRAREPADEAS